MVNVNALLDKFKMELINVFLAQILIVKNVPVHKKVLA